MRPVSSGELNTILNEPSVVHHLRVEVMTSDDTWQDLSEILAQDWLIGATWSTNIDSNLVSGSVRILRERLDTIIPQSAMPMMTGSPVNRNIAEAYAPLLDIGRDIRISTSVTVGGGLIPVSWRHQLTGVVNNITTGGIEDTEVVIAFRDLAARIIDLQIEEEREYGDEEGEPVEDVIQDILTDNDSDVTLFVEGGSPGWMLRPYRQDRRGVHEAALALAQQIGYDLRYDHRGSLDLYGFYLLAPRREIVAADLALGPTQYDDVETFDLALADIRNKIRVEYWDSTAQAVDFVEVEDEDSIARYRTRYMRISLGNTDNIDTEAEALRLANAALADLKDPPVTERIKMPFFPVVQLGDYYEFAANGVHYDTAQKRAVVAYTHTFADGEASTSLDLRGKPAGQYLTWLSMDAGTPGAPGTGASTVFAEIVASTETEITWKVSSPVPSVQVQLVALSGATLVDGPSAGTWAPSGTEWTFARPAGTSGPGSALFGAQAPGARMEYVTVPVTEQGTGVVGLVMQALVTSQSALSYTVQVRVIDPVPEASPAGDVTLTHDANYAEANITPSTPQVVTPTADFSTTPFVEYTVQRPRPGHMGQVLFIASRAARVVTRFPLDIAPFAPEEKTSTTYFSATFENLPDMWGQSGPGTLSVLQNVGELVGSGVVRVTGQKTLTFPVPLAFDPHKFYRFQIRYRQAIDDPVIVEFSAGVIGRKADNTVTNGSGGQQPVLVQTEPGIAADGWKTETAYIQGVNVGGVFTPAALNRDPKHPGKLDDETTQIQPFLLLNNSLGTTGAVDLDYFKIDEYDPEQARRLFGAITESGNVDSGVGQQDENNGRVRWLSRGHLVGIVRDGETIAFPENAEFSAGPPLIRFSGDGMVFDPRSPGNWVEPGTLTPASYTPGAPVYRVMQALNAGPDGFTARLKLVQKGGVPIDQVAYFPTSGYTALPVISNVLDQAPSTFDTYTIRYDWRITAVSVPIAQVWRPWWRIALDVDRLNTGVWTTVYTWTTSPVAFVSPGTRTGSHVNSPSISGLTAVSKFRVRQDAFGDDGTGNGHFNIDGSLNVSDPLSRGIFYTTSSGGAECTMTPDPEDSLMWEALEIGVS